jgi:pimeloyl-ACP methyl ester carboxylesterase
MSVIDRVSVRSLDTGISVTEHGALGPDVSKVVLVHGALDRAKSFLPVVELLPDLRVVEYDRRGYGESLEAGPAELLSLHVDDLLSVMGAEPTSVVAHSFGCVVAVSAAIQYPGRFQGLGLWEPQVPWMEFWPKSVRQGLEAMAAEADTEALAERVYASMVGDEAWRGLPEELKAHRRAEGIAFQRDVIQGLSPPFRWEDLEVPSLFGVGLQSWPFSREAATRLAESLGAELFAIAGAGHSAHVSHPQQFAEFARRTTALSTTTIGRSDAGPGESDVAP